MQIETQWEELAAEVRGAHEEPDGWLPHWSPLRTLASLDRRSEKRHTLVFPIRVHGFDRDNQYFTQKTFTLDVSPGGCRFVLDTEVQRGSVVAVSPFPRSTGDAQMHKALYEVMWVEATNDGWEVGARSLDRKNIWGVTFPEPQLQGVY